MRKTLILMLLAACAPAGQVGSPTPGPAKAPALRDLGRSGGLGAWRLLLDLPTPGYVMVLAGQGTSRLELVPLSMALDALVPAGQHIAIALPAYGVPGAVAATGCSSPVLGLQAAFPVGSGTMPLVTLSEPPLPAAAGAAPVLLEEPHHRDCPPPLLSPRSSLYLLVASEPISAAAVRVALDATVPGTSASEAARRVADALGASLSPTR